MSRIMRAYYASKYERFVHFLRKLLRLPKPRYKRLQEFFEKSRKTCRGNMGKLAIDVDTLSKKKIPKKKKRRTKKRKA